MVDRKDTNSAKLILAVIGAAVIGAVLGAILVMQAMGTRPGDRTVYIVEPSWCSSCNTAFAPLEKKLEQSATADGWKVIKLSALSPRTKQLAKELNTNILSVPAVIVKGDPSSAGFLKKLGARLQRVGDYYIVVPSWPTGVADVTKGWVDVQAYLDKNVIDKNRVVQLVEQSIPNARISIHMAKGPYVLLVTAPPGTLGLLAARIPIAEKTEASIEIPRVVANVSGSQKLVQEINAALRASIPGIGVQESNIPVTGLATIQTNWPELVAKAIPGSQIYNNVVVVPRQETVALTLYLDVNRESKVLKELNELAPTVGARIHVSPIYILLLRNGQVTTPEEGGTEEALREYCVYANYGGAAWLRFALGEDVNVDENTIQKCVQKNGPQIAQVFLNQTYAKRITKQAVVANGWYVTDSPKDAVCTLLNNVPANVCRG